LRRSRLFAIAVLTLVFACGREAAAQIAPPTPDPPSATVGNVHVAGPAGVFDVGSHFLQRLAALSSFRTAASAGNNPLGGGDSTPQERYRAWAEAYGMASRTDAQGDFLGDRRRAYGGVAGVGATVAPGATVGLSVDQSQIRIEIPGTSQTGRINLTQVGLNGAFEHGPWALATSVIHGFGRVHTSRFDAGGESVSSYYARLWGAMAEFSYYLPLPNNARIVPKVTVDWLQSRTDAFSETGGTDPVAGGAMNATRVRLMAGAEIGKTWLANRTLFDFAVYGRLVDNVVQEIDALTILNGAGLSQAVAGVTESQFGADAGATLSTKITQVARVYLTYEGRYRSNFIAHSGILGVEARW
jgi:uncharacterized protein with beta-barrel porin domain